MRTLENKDTCMIHTLTKVTLENQDALIIRTLLVDPKVSILHRLHLSLAQPYK